MDFLSEPETQSINGFPVSFRPITLDDGTTLWVPRGISRNRPLGAWHIYVGHEEGTYQNTIFYQNDLVGSLQTAYRELVDVLSSNRSRFCVDRRNKSPGFERNPLIDTGVTGVVISRNTPKNRKVISIHCAQQIRIPTGRVISTQYYAVGINEQRFLSDPHGASALFHEALKRSVYVRRYYNHLRSQGKHPSARIYFEDVPLCIRRQSIEVPEFDLAELFDSFVAIPKPFKPHTTGGDPSALAVQLQALDLQVPHKMAWLNGFHLRFRPTEVEGHRLYLPKELYRARGEWRIRIYHKEGIWEGAVEDSSEAAGCTVALTDAWTYLISQLRACEPSKTTVKSVGTPLLDTGIPRVTLSAYRRKNRRGKWSDWVVRLVLRQAAEKSQNVSVLIASWHLNELKGDELDFALRKAAALHAYRQDLLDREAPLHNCLVTADTHVPASYWPTHPICRISVDDLLYFTEQQERFGGT